MVSFIQPKVQKEKKIASSPPFKEWLTDMDWWTYVNDTDILYGLMEWWTPHYITNMVNTQTLN